MYWIYTSPLDPPLGAAVPNEILRHLNPAPPEIVVKPPEPDTETVPLPSCKYSVPGVVPFDFDKISLPSISMCCAVDAPPIIKAGLLSVLPAASVVRLKVKVPVTVPPDKGKYECVCPSNATVPLAFGNVIVLLAVNASFGAKLL